MSQQTFHRRNLPPPAISFSSKEGRELFNDALQSGHMEGYFRLAEHFITQGHPAFCGIGSLTMSLNALLLDPKRVWQGVWRWFDESMLSCCEPLDVVKLNGITLAKLGCLAKCNGAMTIVKYGSNTSLEEFRDDVIMVTSLPDNVDHTIMIVSYSRGKLKQSGSGHFSPIGGYCPESDMVLIMDVARFKYPPHWVPLALLYEALQVVDPETSRSRGYMLLSPAEFLGLDHCECNIVTESIVVEKTAQILPVPVENVNGSTAQLVSTSSHSRSTLHIMKTETNKCNSKGEVAVNGVVKRCCNTPNNSVTTTASVVDEMTHIFTSSVNISSNVTFAATTTDSLLSTDNNSDDNKIAAQSMNVITSTTAVMSSAKTSVSTTTTDDIINSLPERYPEIVDDGTRCTFNPDNYLLPSHNNNNNSTSDVSIDGGICRPDGILHEFLKHTCKYCEKQNNEAIQKGNTSGYMKSVPFVAVTY